ncbi:hypothetical protein BCR43DRAFT_503927 [Syncephalastrum racemosum]|uniref:RRM domain-containing protein n=1 Tax=Syncephalastrum racemosum TaxID=13706 RepID=A0A1X2HJI1_SYNRA|nr:hypothetical protein BCR43DRAFT_503927 [Syncephalastrum racemosum]
MPAITVEPETQRFSPAAYYDVYASGPATVTGQMMMSSAYSPSNGNNGTSNNAAYQAQVYASNTGQYTNGSQPAPVLSGSSTPQFVQASLGPPSPAGLGSPLLPQFSTTPSYHPHPHHPHHPHPPHPHHTHPHHPHIHPAALPSPQQLPPTSHQTARTVYIGNLPTDTRLSDVLDRIKSGMIDSVRPLPEKSCIFITFVEASAAAHFYHEATTKKFMMGGNELRIGWGRPSSIPMNIQMALQSGASRNVFLGSLDDQVSDQSLREDLARFGPIEHVKLIKDKNIAFVHFYSTSNAIKCVSSLPTESEWASRRVNYGRDRCAPASSKLQTASALSYMPSVYSNPPSQPGTAAAAAHAAAHAHAAAVSAYPVRLSYDPYTGAPVETYHHPSAPSNDNNAALVGVMNRTIYLGNIHPDTTCEEICNVIRGGILSQIRYLPDKHIAFVTFVDPNLALHFYNQAIYQGLVIKNRRLKVGWGKASALSPAVVAAVQNNGSRNVYLGNIDDTITEEKLKQDFSDYGEIELVNTLKEKKCAFVNFTSIAAAVRAIEGIRFREEYKEFRINYGKDRCGNPPRVNRAYHNHSNFTHHSAHSSSTTLPPQAIEDVNGSTTTSGEQQVLEDIIM